MSGTSHTDRTVSGALGRRHPSLDSRLSEVDPHLSVDLVAKGAVDLAVAHDWDIAPLPAPPGPEQAFLGDDLCDLLVPAGHPFAGRTAVRREELGGAWWICRPPGRVWPAGPSRLAAADAARRRARAGQRPPGR